MSKNQEVRVRIAPSPTGDPHVGTAYIALFNYVFAKKNNGKFILRIEDTDQARAKESSEEQIESSLNWLGLQVDEGPTAGGEYGPYRQSERLDIYQKYVNQLLEEKKAYKCFCTAERLDELRAAQREKGLQTKYDGKCRNLSSEEVEKNISEGKPYVVRFIIEQTGETKFNDLLRGEIEISNERMDDQVILKSDGYPTYHLASVVDDHLMKISHVIRAEEWISSTPKHVHLYRAFGWDEPVWVHMPLLRNTDKSKISKRKNPVSISYYDRAGILPEALVNFLGLMGWSYGDDREIFSLDEMIEVFDMKKVSLGGPVFDLQKLTWLNQTYMHKMDDDAFVSYVREKIFSDKYIREMKPLVLERMSRFEQFVDKNAFFFNGALDYSSVDLVPKKKEKKDIRNMLKELAEKLDDLYTWNAQAIGDLLMAHKNDLEWKPRDYFMTVRLVATGRKDSPPLNETIEVLGRDIVRFRVRDAIKSQSLKD